jgi:hypothetical protein
MANEPRRSSAARGRSPRTRARVRAIVAIALFVFWGLSALTGFLLYVAPTGPRSGWIVLLFLTKSEWGDVHFWASVAAVTVTVVHLVIDRKAVKSVLRFLVSTQRGQTPRE